MHPEHQSDRFLVPRKDDCPDVGLRAPAFVECIQDEVAELAATYFPGTGNAHLLVRFGMAVVGMIERRAAADVADFSAPVVVQAAPSAEIDPAARRKIAASELGRILDWICKDKRVVDMGVRVAAVASHIRAAAIDNRTDQQLAHEIGNGSRESVSKVRKQFRLDMGADYPGEHGKGSNTKARCKTSRLRKLKKPKN